MLLLDEPLGALDLKLRKQMQVELKRIQQEVGITFIYVTHDQEEAMTMSDRIAVMNQGRYEQLGDPESAVRAAPDPLRRRLPRGEQPAAGDGRSAGRRLCTVRLTDDRTIRIPGRPRRRRHPGEHRHPAREDSPHEPDAATTAGHNRLTGAVRAASYLGVSTQYEVQSGGDRLTVYEQNTERANRADHWTRGDAVQLTWSPDHSFVVPPDDRLSTDVASDSTADPV